MYHDQGLPVLKYKGFGAAVNVTLGLPIIRTSVDHGTALDLAGTGTSRHRQPAGRPGNRLADDRPPRLTPPEPPLGGRAAGGRRMAASGGQPC